MHRKKICHRLCRTLLVATEIEFCTNGVDGSLEAASDVDAEVGESCRHGVNNENSCSLGAKE